MRNSAPSYREQLLEDAVGVQIMEINNHEQSEQVQRITKSKRVYPWSKSLPRIQKTFGSSINSLASIQQELKERGYCTLLGSLELANRIIPWLYSEKTTSLSTKSLQETNGLMDTVNNQSSSSKSSPAVSVWEQHSACVIQSRLWWKSKEDSLTWWQATTSSSPTLPYKTAMREVYREGGMRLKLDSLNKTPAEQDTSTGSIAKLTITSDGSCKSKYSPAARPPGMDHSRPVSRRWLILLSL